MIGRVFAALFALAILFLATMPVWAHSWYPYNCCSDKDCRPLAPGEVKITPRGYEIPSLGKVVAPDMARPVPPSAPAEAQQLFHVCTINGESGVRAQLLCLFVPQGGV